MPDDADGVPAIRRPEQPDTAGSRRGGDRVTEGARIEAAQRRRKVVQLRAAGLDFETIATQTGYSDKSGAYRAWRDALVDVVRVPAREALDLELSRLDALQQAVWAAAMKGTLPAIDRALAIAGRRAKLLGLDTAVKLEVVDAAALAEARAAAGELVTALFGERDSPA